MLKDELYFRRYGGYFFILLFFAATGFVVSYFLYDFGVMFFLMWVGFIVLGLMVGKLWMRFWGG